MAVPEFLILERGRRRFRSVAAAAGRAHFARLDRLHTSAVLGGYGFLAEVPDGVRYSGPAGVVRFLRYAVAFVVVFGAGAAATYDAGRVLVDGDG